MQHARLASLLALVILGTSAAVGQPIALADEPLAAVAPLAPQPHVGLQVGHWAAQQLPDELADLRDNSGAARDGYRELDTNYAVTEAAAADLRAQGVRVDVLPATVPPGYQADAFVAVHADQEMGDHARGYKIAPSAVTLAKSDSSLLANDIAGVYSAQTGLPPDLRPDAITADMRWYFAFNWRYYTHAVAPSTPAAIIEMGFITDPTDRDLLFNHPDVAGQALAGGILQYLQDRAGGVTV